MRALDLVTIIANLAPYTALAANYDRALGRESLRRAIATIDRLVDSFALEFHSLADIGCGTGLFAAHMARCWKIGVFAVDRSHAMLREAVRNGARLPICFLRQDMRRLRLPEPVDLMTANFDVINNILWPDELVATFKGFRRNLRPSGHLVFDFVTDRVPWLDARWRVRRLLSRSGDLWQSVTWRPASRLLFITLTQRWPEAGVQTIERHIERGYPAPAMTACLHRSGWSIRALLDADTLQDAGPSSTRIVVVARAIGGRRN